MTKSEPKMMVMIGDLGSKRLELSTVLSQKEFSELILETNRIFSFALRTWDAETGNAVIELVPGNWRWLGNDRPVARKSRNWS